jgi:hypothetical protein
MSIGRIDVGEVERSSFVNAKFACFFTLSACDEYVTARPCVSSSKLPH